MPNSSDDDGEMREYVRRLFRDDDEEVASPVRLIATTDPAHKPPRDVLARILNPKEED